MTGLMLFVLLLLVGTLITYRFSSASKAKKRMQKALSPFEELSAELGLIRENIRKDIERTSSLYLEEVYSARIRAIAIDELKKYASGIRLQALKDIGITSVADLQGWNEYRVSQVRGVGPKSASAIVAAVYRITVVTKSVPIDHPAPPFSGESKFQLMQALYRQHWFDMHIAELSDAFAKDLASHQSTRDEVIKKTTFIRWLWKFGSNETIRHNVNRASDMIAALTAENCRSMRDKLSKSLSECRAICANRVPSESVVSDFTDKREFYISRLTARFGKSTVAPPAPPIFQKPISNTNVAPNAQTKDSEGLISVSVGLNVGKSPTEFALPISQRAERSKAVRWLARGVSVQIQDHTLAHGLVYVGKGINFEQFYSLNTWLPAKTEGSDPQYPLGYYSSYNSLTAEQRSRYLDWLAGGAKSPTETGFGMMYFYGLERRVVDLIQGNVPDSPPDELVHLLEEVHRLGTLFRDVLGGVKQCCQRLSEFAAARAFNGVSVPQLPPEWDRTYELPFILRYGLGCFMRDNKPIPAEWALRWSYVEPTIYFRTPATRCPKEYEAAFVTLYHEKHGEGFLIPPNKKKLKLLYQPGWPIHLEPEIKYEFSDIPDITALSAPQQMLKTLVEQSTTMIDVYSRYIGRNATKEGSLEAFLNLPLRLWPSSGKDSWNAFLSNLVEPIKPLPFETLLSQLGYVGDPALAKTMEIVTNLNSAQVGFEPDILVGARRPKPTDQIVLFPLTSETDTDRTADEFKKASLTVSLSACIALADGYASEEEATAVETMIASWQHLHVDLRTRLRAQYRLQVLQGISLASFKSRFVNLPPDGRMQLAMALSSLATVDGNVAPAEVKLLEQVYRALELDPQLLYSHLNSASRRGHPLEISKFEASATLDDYGFDNSRLAALRKETEQVGALLARVFVDEEGPDRGSTGMITAASIEAHSEQELLPGLDSKHQRFVAELLLKPSWTRSELEETAAKMQIMLDGALERINEAAFDLIGEPLTEGDDPIYVQQNILENAEQ